MSGGYALSRPPAITLYVRTLSCFDACLWLCASVELGLMCTGGMHRNRTVVTPWPAFNSAYVLDAVQIVKVDAMNWIVFSLYGSTPAQFQEVLSAPDAR